MVWLASKYVKKLIYQTESEKESEKALHTLLESSNGLFGSGLESNIESDLTLSTSPTPTRRKREALQISQKYTFSFLGFYFLSK